MTAPEQVPRTRSGWDLLRLLLAVVWLALLLTAVALREEQASLAELYADVEAGRVERVQLVGGLGAFDDQLPDELAGTRSGTAYLDVRWGPLGDRRSAALVEVAGQAQPVSADGREVTDDDVAARLRALDPGLVVEQQPYRSGWTGSLLGAPLPGVLLPVLVGAGLATLLLLVSGPQPWRATRWGWFWLLPVPFGGLAFCLLSGPTPGLPAPRDERRLTGGWAFLIGAVLGGGTWAT